jgi:hypothetical protein
MRATTANTKKVKDLTVKEFKQLVQKSIAEDIEAWRDTFEILADPKLMAQIRKAEKARLEGKRSEFVSWEKVRRDV